MRLKAARVTETWYGPSRRAAAGRVYGAPGTVHYLEAPNVRIAVRCLALVMMIVSGCQLLPGTPTPASPTQPGAAPGATAPPPSSPAPAPGAPPPGPTP